MEEICYKSNPITEAIARVDFLNPIVELGQQVPKEIGSIIKQKFPIVEPKEVISQELRIGETKEITESKTTEWTFFNKDRTKRLSITDTHMLVVHNVYETYEKFYDDFNKIFDALYDSFKGIQIKRFGVRYINNISIDEDDPFNWRKYLNPKLFSALDIPENKKTISRSFHTLQLNLKDYYMRFQFGMHNPDFPAPIKKKIFVLDIDAFFAGLLDKDDVYDNFSKFHTSIQSLFEKSITEQYRKKLNNGK